MFHSSIFNAEIYVNIAPSYEACCFESERKSEPQVYIPMPVKRKLGLHPNNPEGLCPIGEVPH